MIQIKTLFDIGENITNSFIERVKSRENSISNIETFDGLPTSVIFEPYLSKFKGSLHYMRFPNGKTQRWHYHYKQRYLLIIGSCPLNFSFSELSTNSNPNKEFETKVLEPYKIHSIRFSKEVWHKFNTISFDKGDLIAFSFHEDDDGEIFNNGFMEELTVFFNEK